ncbi:phosphatidylinositol N-acetylglucosaminyltransferase, putative [Plasmodium ovale curtisi]|uniref:Phosphatidylinositol N-acetylglucosaminyltransferase, putative n=1 Tax=Plasmodium ovale curtisi TaxID=864141 RepID=A0A1A8VQH8_PLAOA|nr:phosphatidylinositol N-acetylglucosaminyltransferase, putative [Plasmodium ovale curtisi]
MKNAFHVNNRNKTEMKKKKWRKILYEDQGYEDNYVHNSFLSSLLTNFGIKYKYSHVCYSMLCILSPVLISLTQTHSDDTVFLVSILLLLIHLMFHNYGFIYEKNENIDIFDATSLSCVVIASVILGSRLASIEKPFFLFPIHSSNHSRKE